ncbi:RNA pseudouridine synthase [Candidatus Falkowbacteria bacterium CG10_big_fil_rev_8_21_14_0_10_43_10]|uniref:Pseudouridine synthase n=1 Tax=Candidatus Falkowbacteria bacterium CG10_big_fil_rev_8_21_14_0_10_43_10 TaxID=1974567 RepID=A0A2H0V428_9BACT|nr:MAG: RNA pseudouridine synthase [Candidatus Falkowbacteria bacterium CG10_big_fil_rev_8_21_14_0_10_43_10]
MQKLKVKKNDSGQRLDIFLTDKLNLSRSKVQKLIKRGAVLVNDKVVSAHYTIQENDKIYPVKSRQGGDFAESKIISQGKLPKFKIISETDDYLVINKPAGVIVHGGEGINKPTLTDALEKKYPAIKKIGEDPLRPGIVHRLDKEASGLMVIAKNNKTFDHLKEQFKKRAILKKYLALVHGRTEKENDEIDFPISRSAKGYKMAARPNNQGGRRAITDFAVKQNFINYTLLEVAIKTGRTHQIRVHLSAYGQPVVGDDLYGNKKTRAQNAKLKLKRIFLHAYILGFYDLRGKWQEFKIELPVELKKILKNVK